MFTCIRAIRRLGNGMANNHGIVDLGFAEPVGTIVLIEKIEQIIDDRD